VVVVAGLGGLGRRLGEEVVFRPELFAELGGLEPGGIITAESAARVAYQEKSFFWNAPAGCRKMVFLNQADLVAPGEAWEAARVFYEMGRGLVERVVWGALQRPADGFGVWKDQGPAL
ncbi:MAG: hypothetical protein AB1896_14715, partial [Thermodesulfobacteriota bacterium]